MLPLAVFSVVTAALLVLVVSTVRMASNGYKVLTDPSAASTVVLGSPCVMRTIPPPKEIFHGRLDDDP